MTPMTFAKKTLICSLIACMGAELTACGTILYPERKGTKSGQIDPAVAIMDAAGLILFFIPGVIAFAVDFSNGTIYLPHGRHSSLSPAEMEQIKAQGKVDVDALNKVLSEKLSTKVDVKQQGTQIQKTVSLDAALARLDSSMLVLASAQ